LCILISNSFFFAHDFIEYLKYFQKQYNNIQINLNTSYHIIIHIIFLSPSSYEQLDIINQIKPIQNDSKGTIDNMHDSALKKADDYSEEHQRHSENEQRGAHHREIGFGGHGVVGQTGGDPQGHDSSDQHQLRLGNGTHEGNLELLGVPCNFRRE
jgi:hypothetical protein